MNIRLMNVALLLSVASAFAPIKLATTTTISTTSTSLMMEPSSWSRRDLMTHGLWIAGILTTLEPTRSANAFDQQLDPYEVVSSQQYTGGKIDLNSAFVGEYKTLRGMFPTAAGKIASHGPYKEVKDIYKIPGLTANDKKLFKEYESQFTVNPPGRTFDERINSRVST